MSDDNKPNCLVDHGGKSCPGYPPPTEKREDGERWKINPKRYGKSTLVTNAFLAEAEAGKSVKFESPHYICLSRKALSDLLKSEEKRVRGETLKLIDPFDLVQECNPDCTPEEHAYHKGTWDSFLKLERILKQLEDETL